MECVFLYGVTVFLKSYAESPFPPPPAGSNNSPLRGALLPRQLFTGFTLLPGPQFPHQQNGDNNGTPSHRVVEGT